MTLEQQIANHRLTMNNIRIYLGGTIGMMKQFGKSRVTINTWVNHPVPAKWRPNFERLEKEINVCSPDLQVDVNMIMFK